MLGTCLKLRYHGRISHLSGIDIHRKDFNRPGLEHTNLITKLSEAHFMTDANPVQHPSGHVMDLSLKTESLYDGKVHRCKSKDKSVLYLATKTKPDLCIITGMLGWVVANRIEQQMSSAM